MKEIKINVKDENLNIVMTILDNLKAGLICDIQIDGKKNTHSRYMPKTNNIIKEGSKPKGKYLSKDEYQRRKVK